MSMPEWRLEDALVVEREEGREEGWEEGREEGREKQAAEILNLIDSGYSLEDLRKTLGKSRSIGNR
jgi:flagellar biosynthesis/type III secretory pathway protein FliH